MLGIETLYELQTFFNAELQSTLNSMTNSDSGRLLDNRVNGFLICLQDRLLTVKPSFKCACGGVQGSVLDYRSAANRTSAMGTD